VRLSADTRVWIALGVLVLLGILFSLGRTAPEDRTTPEVTPLRSTYRTRPSGLRALYLTLQQLGYPARRFHEPLTALEEDGALVIAEPVQEITPREWEALQEWVERGNLLLLFSDTGHLFEPGGRYRTFTPTSPANAAPVQPTPAAAGAAVHVVQTPYHFEEESWSPRQGQEESRTGAAPASNAPLRRIFAPRPVVALYADRTGPVLSLARWGKGVVLLSCSPWSLSNEGIARGNNLTLFLNLLDVYGAGKRRPIYFDEYHQGHGGAAGPLSLVAPVARAGLAQIVVALLLLVYAVSRRFGAVVPVETLERRTRAEYLGAMALLFRRARALELVAGKLRDETERELARGLGLPPTARPEEIARTAEERRGVSAERVLAALEEADLLSVARAREVPIDESRVLALAARLHELRKDILRWQ
jgi:hypothetical protein